MIYLVHNESEGITSYGDEYVIFENADDAIKHAKLQGFTDPFGIGLNLKPGVLNMCCFGEIKISIIALEAR